jgi:hypothetical protein
MQNTWKNGTGIKSLLPERIQYSGSGIPLWVFGYGVMAVTSPGVAAADAANAHPEASKNAPFPDGLDHVVGAGRLIAAVTPEKWGNKPLI